MTAEHKTTIEEAQEDFHKNNAPPETPPGWFPLGPGIAHGFDIDETLDTWPDELPTPQEEKNKEVP